MIGKELKELTKHSRKGYIDDPDDIKYIIKKLSGLTLSEAVDMAGDDTEDGVMLFAQLILNDVYELGLDDDEIKEIGFPEFLYLVERMGMTPESSGYTASDIYRESRDDILDTFYHQPKSTEWYAGVRMLIYLFEQGAKNNDLFRLFSSIHIGTLFERTDKTDSSIGDIIAREHENRNKYWRPWDSLQAYERQIQKAYETSASLLIGAFRHTCPEKFSMDYILGKYGSWFTKAQTQMDRSYLDEIFEECLLRG